VFSLDTMCSNNTPASDAVACGQEGVKGNHQSVCLAVTAVFCVKIILHAYPVANFQKCQLPSIFYI